MLSGFYAIFLENLTLYWDSTEAATGSVLEKRGF